MSDKKKKATTEKTRLHTRNKNRDRYDLDALVKAIPALGEHVKPNKYGDDSVDFANPDAVKLLNKALLKHYYKVDNWDIPEGYLCPPIPGRADYIHNMADLLADCNKGKIPKGEKINCLDIGVGANCIYPIIGVQEYDWSFIGSDTDEKAVISAQKIVEGNESLEGKIKIVHQKEPKDFYYGAIRKLDMIDLTFCNPPFHASAQEAAESSSRKVKNLKKDKNAKTVLNFAGQSNELWTEGGERKFVSNMINQSKKFAENVFWFSTLVSKQSNLNAYYTILQKMGAKYVETIPMGTGNKSTRIVAWSFLDLEQQEEWAQKRWI